MSFLEYWGGVRLSTIIRYSPCCNEARNIRVMAGANSVANSFNNLMGMWSGPSALWGFNPCSSFLTPSLLTVINKGVDLREQAFTH